MGRYEEKKMRKKFFAILLCVLVVWSLLPPMEVNAGTAGIQYAPYLGVNFMNAPISAQRKAALKKAMQMVTVKWTCPADFPIWCSSDNSIGTAIAIDGTAVKKFIKGKTYTGIPYSMSDHTVDDIAWHNALKGGKITTSYMTGSYHGNGTTTAHGMDCSYFVYLALKAANAGSVTYRNIRPSCPTRLIHAFHGAICSLQTCS